MCMSISTCRGARGAGPIGRAGGPKLGGRLDDVVVLVSGLDEEPVVDAAHQGLTLVHFLAHCELFSWTAGDQCRLDVNSFCGLCWEVLSTKAFQVALRSGRLMWPQ
jgi:hypothetical protein